MGDLIGLTNKVQVSINNLTTGLINLSVYSKVILRTQGITNYLRKSHKYECVAIIQWCHLLENKDRYRTV
jgi:hypothetical protein